MKDEEMAEEYLKEKLEERKDKFVFELPEVYVADIKQAFKDGAEFGYNKANEEFKICEQNADTYYDKLQKAKQIIQEFLELNYSEFTKTNAVFLHADKFLKE